MSESSRSDSGIFGSNEETLAKENEVLRSQLAKSLQLTEQMKIVNQKNCTLSNELRALKEKYESAQQCLQIMQTKSQQVKDLSMKLKSVTEDNKTLREKTESLQEKNQKANDRIAQFDKYIEQMRSREVEHIESCGSVLGKKCRSIADVTAAIKEFVSGQNHKDEKDEAVRQSTVEMNKTLKTLEKLSRKNNELQNTQQDLLSRIAELETNSANLSQEKQVIKLKMDNLMKENERWKEDNDKLQQSIAELRREHDDENERLKNTLEIKDKRIEELEKLLEEPLVDKDAARKETELQRLINAEKTWAVEKKELQKRNEQLNSLLRTAKESLKNVQEDRSEIKKSLQQSLNTEKELSTRNSALVTKNKALEESLTGLRRECERLRAEIEGREEESVRHDLYSPNLLESLLESQRQDLDRMGKQRNALISVVQKQSMLILQYERAAKAHNVEKAYPDKVKPKISPTEQEPKDSIRREVIKVLGAEFLPKFQQRDQQILKEALRDPLDPIGSLAGVLLKTRNYHENRSSAILSSAINALTTLLCDGQHSPVIDFLATEMSHVEANLKRGSGQSLIPLFTGTYRERLKTLERIRDEGWNAQETFDVLTMLVIANVAQEREFRDRNSQLIEATKWIQDYKSIFGDMSLSALEQSVFRLHRTVQRTKQLKRELKQARDAHEHCQELETIRRQHEKEIQDLKNSMQTFINDSEATQAQTEVQLKEKAKIERDYESLLEKVAKERKHYMHEIENYQEKLRSKNEERKQMAANQAERSADYENKRRELEAENAKLKSDRQRLIEAVKSMKMKQQKSRKLMQKQLETCATEKTEEIKNLLEMRDALKEKLDETQRIVKQKMSENKALGKQIKTLTAKNQEMSNDISKLSVATKASELKIASLNEQLTRDRDVLQTQFKFKCMSQETKHQNQIANLENQHNTQITALQMSLTQAFDDLIAVDIFSPEFNSRIKQIGEDYRRLKYHNGV